MRDWMERMGLAIGGETARSVRECGMEIGPDPFGRAPLARQRSPVGQRAAATTFVV